MEAALRIPFLHRILKVSSRFLYNILDKCLEMGQDKH